MSYSPEGACSVILSPQEWELSEKIIVSYIGTVECTFHLDFESMLCAVTN